MSVVADTRLWQGSVLSVRDAVGVGTAWIDYAHVISYSMPGTEPERIDANTAGTSTDTFRLGIRKRGEATFSLFDYPDSPFFVAITAMKTGGETRSFKLTMPEGTNKVRTFTAFVLSNPINGEYNGLWKMELGLKVQTDAWWGPVV